MKDAKKTSRWKEEKNKALRICNPRVHSEPRRDETISSLLWEVVICRELSRHVYVTISTKRSDGGNKKKKPVTKLNCNPLIVVYTFLSLSLFLAPHVLFLISENRSVAADERILTEHLIRVSRISKKHHPDTFSQVFTNISPTCKIFNVIFVFSGKFPFELSRYTVEQPKIEIGLFFGYLFIIFYYFLSLKATEN